MSSYPRARASSDLVLHRRALRRRPPRVQALPRGSLSRGVRLLGRRLPRRLGGGDRSGPQRQPSSGLASTMAPLNWDAPERLEYLDSQGIAAEVFFPTPPRRSTRRARSLAGATKRRGVRAARRRPPRTQPLAGRLLQRRPRSVGRVRADLSRRHRRSYLGGAPGKGSGPAGRLLPNDHVLRMANLYYPEYDRLWAGLRRARAPRPSPHELPDGIGARRRQRGSPLVGMVEMQFYVVRAIGHMILSGAFDVIPTSCSS